MSQLLKPALRTPATVHCNALLSGAALASLRSSMLPRKPHSYSQLGSTLKLCYAVPSHHQDVTPQPHSSGAAATGL